MGLADELRKIRAVGAASAPAARGSGSLAAELRGLQAARPARKGEEPAATEEPAQIGVDPSGLSDAEGEGVVRTVADAVRAIPGAAAQTVKDVGGAVMAMGGGLIKAVPSLVTGIPGVVGETAKGTVRDIERHVKEGQEAVGASRRAATTAIPDAAGQLLALGGPTVRATNAISKLPGMTRLAAAAASGSKTARAAENIIQGQIVTGLYTAGRDPGEGESRAEAIKDAAEFDAAITTGAIVLPPLLKGGLTLGGKVIPEAVKSKFRWLGSVSDDVRGFFEKYVQSTSEGSEKVREFAVDMKKLTPTERLRVGQRLRGSITTEERHQVDEAARQGWTEIQGKLDALNADKSVAVEVRGKQIQELRKQQRDLLSFAGSEEPVEAMTRRGRELLDPESAALRKRKNLNTVYYEPLTRQQRGELSAERGELTSVLKKDLQLFNQKSIKANGGNAQVEDLLDSLPEIVKLSRGEVSVLGETKRALKEEFEHLVKMEPFAGRKQRVKETVERIQQINESIQTSYKFGGSRYSPRMYFSKEQEQVINKYGVMGPKVDDTLRAKRDALAPGARAADKATLEVRQEQLRDEGRRLSEALDDGVDTVEGATIKHKDLKSQLGKTNAELARVSGRLAKLNSDEILDPTFPVAEKVRRLVRDRAATDLFTSLAKRPDVVRFGSSPGKDFVQLNGKTLGKLDGAWVHKDIAGELREISGTKSRAERIYNALIGVWKVNKTALNPATHARNIFGNTLFLDFAGVGIAKQPQAYNEAVAEMLRDSPAWREFRRTGLTLGTFSRAQLERIAGITGKVRDADEWFERLAKLQESIPGAKALKAAYQAEDEVARYIAFRHAKELGLSTEEAVNHVNRYLPNYAKIPRNAVTKMMGAWNPFFAFTFSSTPIMVKNLAEQPVKLAKWFALGKTINELSTRMLGIPEEQEHHIREVLPNYMQKGDVFAPSVMPLLPQRDKYGRLIFLDMSYYVPMNNLLDEPNSALGPQLLQPGNPALRTIGEVWLNKQGYNQQPIYRETDSPGMVVGKVATYLYNQAAPSIAGWGVRRISRAIMQSPDYKGRVQDIGPAVADALFGVKTRAIDPAEEQRFRTGEINQDIRETRMRMRSVQRDQRLDESERTTELKRLRGRIVELNGRKRDMAQ